MNTVKYPKTLHLPWSQTISRDDKIQYDLNLLTDIVITEKMDGENITISRDRIYARSLETTYHNTHSYVKGIWGRIKYLIPSNIRICGENLVAKHSIHYTNLKDLFLVFSIWDNDICLDWNLTNDICLELELELVPVLFMGKFNQSMIKNFHNNLDLNKSEGYVIRNISSFTLGNFDKNVVKFVRANHVMAENHWKFQKIILNSKAEIKDKV